MGEIAAVTAARFEVGLRPLLPLAVAVVAEPAVLGCKLGVGRPQEVGIRLPTIGSCLLSGTGRRLLAAARGC